MTHAPLTEPDVSDDAAAAADLDMSLLRRYRELRTAANVSDAETKALKAEADKLEQDVVDMLGEAGVQNMNVDGSVIYLHRSTFAQRAEGVTAEQIREALVAAGDETAALVTETVNAQTLSAYVREILDREEPGKLPGELADLLELGERYSARLRAAPKARGGSRRQPRS